MEIKTEVKTFLVEHQCEFCRSGTFVKGTRYYSNAAGTFFPHTCTNCGHSKEFKNVSYPHYVYEKMQP